MDITVAGVRIVLAPGFAAGAVAFVLAGVALGTISGLTPGLHANNFALMLAAAAPAIPGPPTYVGAAMLAAGVVHTFLDVVPALALGVPDPAMAATALPGHQLVLEGRGREALRLSALGSGLAVVIAVPLAIPVTLLMVRLYPVVRPRIAIVLTALVVFMIATESTTRARLGAAAAFGLSAVLGVLLLDLPAAGLIRSGDMLAPLFAGLFGASVLVDAVGGAGVPEQADTRIVITRRAVALTAAAGAVAGAVVGYLPGVSSAIAAVLVLAAFPTAAGARGFVVATSGINTSNTI